MGDKKGGLRDCRSHRSAVSDVDPSIPHAPDRLAGKNSSGRR
jgi:hypothetical protein